MADWLNCGRLVAVVAVVVLPTLGCSGPKDTASNAVQTPPSVASSATAPQRACVPIASALLGDLTVSVPRGSTKMSTVSIHTAQTIVIALERQCGDEMVTQSVSVTKPAVLKLIRQQLAPTGGGVSAQSYLAMHPGIVVVTLTSSPFCAPSMRCPWVPGTTIGTILISIKP